MPAWRKGSVPLRRQGQPVNDLFAVSLPWSIVAVRRDRGTTSGRGTIRLICVKLLDTGVWGMKDVFVNAHHRIRLSAGVRLRPLAQSSCLT